MRNLLAVLIGTGLALAPGCGKKAEEPAASAPAAAAPEVKPRATVVLRDGSRVMGTVVSSTPAEMTLAGDDGITRTIPTDKVQSVQYGDAAQPPRAPAASGAPQPLPSGERRAAQRELIPSKPVVTPPAPREVQPLILPAGTEIAVRAGETIDSSKAAEGQAYAADVAKNISDASGHVVIPKGADARIVIRSLSKGGKITGATDLVLDLISVRIDGRTYDVDTADLGQKGRSGIGANKRTAEFTGGGAAVGAIIGAIAGGGRGAAIGGGAGAGAGALTQILTKGSIKVPVETVLTFKLDRALRVVPR